MEWTYGVAIESFTASALLCQKACRRSAQDNRTSHWSRHGEHRKSLRKRWPMVKLCSRQKNDPSKGQIGLGQHHKRRKTIMHGTNSGILQALFCGPGGIYRPEFLKVNLTMTARHSSYPGQWPGCGSLCPYDLVTPKSCSWGSLLNISKVSRLIRFTFNSQTNEVFGAQSVV
jgi:hypothetical protein